MKHLSPVELEYLAALWPTSLSDARLCDLFGMGRGSLHRVATERLKLPCRVTARAKASERYFAIVAAALQREAA